MNDQAANPDRVGGLNDALACVPHKSAAEATAS